MRNGLAAAHTWLARIILGVIVLQFFLAGVGAFGAADWGPHAITGSLLIPVSLVLLLLALVGGVGRRGVVLSALLFVLFIVQLLLAGMARDVSPWIGALHPVNALVLLYLTFKLAHTRRTHTTTVEPTAPERMSAP